MPLVLNTQPETERPQLIIYDPSIEEDRVMARRRMEDLLKKGFSKEYHRCGEIRLVPPLLQKGFGVMRILSQNGDDRITWDTSMPKQVKEAGKKFMELIKKGYKACAPEGDGSPGREIKEFDPELGEVIMVPSTVPG